MRVALQVASGLGIFLLLAGCDKSTTNVTSEDSAPLRAISVLPAGVLDGRALIEFSMAARDYKPKDDFSAQTLNDGPLVGRVFRVDLDMADLENSELPKIYQYDFDERALKLSLFPGAIQIYTKTIDLPDESRSNAFGATVQVTRKEVESFYVGPTIVQLAYDQSTKPEEMGVFKLKSEYDSNSETNNYSFDELEKKIPMTPDQAREVSRQLHLIVEGVVTKDDYGSAVACDRSGSAATISSPSEIIFNKCTVSARFTKIQIISPKDGILASWK